MMEIEATELHKEEVDVAELAGSVNVFDPLVGRVLYKRLRNALENLKEPGVLVVDFSKVNLVDTSALLISVVKLLVLSRRNQWQKTMICVNVTSPQLSCLGNAVAISPDAYEAWVEEPRYPILLVAASRGLNSEDDRCWQLLGELDEAGTLLWTVSQENGCARAGSLVEQIESDRDSIASAMELFLDNQILVQVRSDVETMLCPINVLLELETG